MTQLESNDLAIIFNRRVIANYMTSVDFVWRPDIEAEIAAQEIVAGTCDPADQTCLAFWLDRGLEFQAESVGNMFMPVPRILYATGNANFSWDPNAPDPVVNRLNKFNDPTVAPVGATATLPSDAGGPGIPPCSIPMNEDSSGMRFTFVRTFFDTTDNPPTLQVVNGQGLDVMIQGDVYKGGWFSRRRALDMNRQTHKFTMTLRYRLQYVTPQSNTVHLGQVPFRMQIDPGVAPGTNGGPPFSGGVPLPAKDRFVYAFRRVDPTTGARIPGQWDLPPISATPETLAGELFLGEPGDIIFESAAAPPTGWRYLVVAAPGDESAEYLLIDRSQMQGNSLPPPLSKGYVGRLALVFDKVTALDLTPSPLHPSEQKIDDTQQGIGKAISNSLVRINPTLFQVFSCPDAQNAPASPLTRDVLPLFAPTSLTIPMMTYPTVQPIFARIVSVDDKSNGDPGLVGSVRSETQEFNLKSERYFAHPEDAARQSFGIGGALMEDPSDPNSGQGSTFDDFSVALDSFGNPQGPGGSPGASFAVGVSALFLREQFATMEGRIRAEILKEQPNAAITTASQIVDGGFQVYAKAEGEIETPWPFPNIGWEVETWVTARTRVQKRIVVNGSGAPLDRFGCPIPQGGLDALGRDVANGFIDLPFSAAASNPLGYRAYNDPDNGINCIDNCDPIIRIGPTEVNATGGVVPPAPPPPCTGVDDTEIFGQIDFPESGSTNAGLKPIFEVIIPPPAKDDIEVVQSLDWFAVFASFSLGMLLTVLIPIGGPQLSPIVLSLGLTAIFLAPLASTILNAFIRDEIHAGAVKQGREVLPQETQPTRFLGMFLVNPTGPTGPAFETRGSNFLPQPGAVISRFDVVWTPDNIPQGF